MYAIIETGGKQLKVEAGDTIFVEKLDVEEGTEYTFEKVLLVGDNGVKVGHPYVEGAKVTATVENRVRKRRLLYSSISQRSIIIRNRVIDSLILS